MHLRENLINKDTWLRGFFILLFGFVFNVLWYIIALLVVFQFLFRLITGDINVNMSDLSKSLSSYAKDILDYITFQSDQRPFPFKAWSE